jgi:hypothetical protein
MKDIIAFTLLLPLLLFFMIQPMLHDAEQSRGEVAQIAIQRATEKAAIEGYYTDEVIQEIYDMLSEVGYSEDEIKLEVTTTLKYRGEYVSGRVKVPNKYFFLLFDSLLRIKNKDPMYHIKSATRLSEYID